MERREESRKKVKKRKDGKEEGKKPAVGKTISSEFGDRADTAFTVVGERKK